MDTGTIIAFTEYEAYRIVKGWCTVVLMIVACSMQPKGLYGNNVRNGPLIQRISCAKSFQHIGFELLGLAIYCIL